MSSPLFRRALSAGILFFALAKSAPAVNVLIAIDHTGANQQVSANTSRTWNFAIKAGYSITVGRASFGLNAGNKTVEDITFKVWSGLGGDVAGNSLLTTVSLAPAMVDNSFSTLENFDFAPLPLAAGYYSVTLSTNAATGNQSYYLKSGRAVLKIDDDSGLVLGSDYWLQDANDDGTATVVFSPIPEPTSLLFLLGCALLLWRRRRNGSVH
ncbi:MAG: hypothetical protein ACO3RV_05215 [Luteolibacter sp.]